MKQERVVRKRTRKQPSVSAISRPFRSANFVKGYPYMQQRTVCYARIRDNDQIETKWLPVGHLEFYICKIHHVLSLCIYSTEYFI